MPGCQDYDRDFIHMPVCEHLTPIKFNCRKCNEKSDNFDVPFLKLRIKNLEDKLYLVNSIIEAAGNAESLFASKVHDLKFIDKKRDDVINALCQKIARLETEISLIRVTVGKMIFKE